MDCLAELSVIFLIYFSASSIERKFWRSKLIMDCSIWLDNFSQFAFLNFMKVFGGVWGKGSVEIKCNVIKQMV